VDIITDLHWAGAGSNFSSRWHLPPPSTFRASFEKMANPRIRTIPMLLSSLQAGMVTVRGTLLREALSM